MKYRSTSISRPRGARLFGVVAAAVCAFASLCPPAAAQSALQAPTEQEQAIIQQIDFEQKLDDQIGNTPALLLSGDPRKLGEAFQISEEKGAGDMQVFVLKPRGKEALFDHLRVQFKGNVLVRMELADSLGQKTDIFFTEVKVNPALPAALFEFTPPKGVDVIDQF